MATLFDDLVDGGGDLYFDNLDAAPITGTEPAITAVGTLRYLGSATITGERFGASQGAGSVLIGGVAQPIVSWSDTSIVIGPIARGALKYGNQPVVVTSDEDGSSNPSVHSLLPQTGWNYVNLASPLAAPADRLTTTPDLVAGDQVAWGNITPSGAVTVFSDGSFTATAPVGSFAFEANDGTGWAGFATQFVSEVAAFSGSFASGVARITGSFAVNATGQFSGSLVSGPAQIAGTFLVFTSASFSGQLLAGPAQLQGLFQVIGAVTPTPAPPTPTPGTGTPEAKVANVNRALIKLGASPINSFQDNVKAARVAAMVYDRVRDRELAKYIWSFALTFRRQPEFVSDEPRKGYRYTYTKPIDWLQTVWIGELVIGSPDSVRDVHEADWHHEGEYILSNQKPPLPLQYIKRVSDPTKFHVLFADALECALAMEMCEAITGSTSRWDAMRLQYREAIAEARKASAILNPPRRVTSSVSDSWLDARH